MCKASERTAVEYKDLAVDWGQVMVDWDMEKDMMMADRSSTSLTFLYSLHGLRVIVLNILRTICRRVLFLLLSLPKLASIIIVSGQNNYYNRAIRKATPSRP